MLRTIPIALVCSLFFLSPSRGQDVFVPRQSKAEPSRKPAAEPAPETRPAKPAPVKTEPARAAAIKESSADSSSEKTHPAKEEAVVKPPGEKEPATVKRSGKSEALKFAPVKLNSPKEPAPTPYPEKVKSAKTETIRPLIRESATPPSQPEKWESVNADGLKVPPTNETVASQKPKQNPPVKAESRTETVRPLIREPVTVSHSEKIESTKADALKVPATKETAANQKAKQSAPVKADSRKSASGEEPAVAHSEKAKSPEPAKPSVAKKEEKVKADLAKAPEKKETAGGSQTEKEQSAKTETAKTSGKKGAVASSKSEKVQPEKSGPGKSLSTKNSGSDANAGKSQAAKSDSAKTTTNNDTAANTRSESVQPSKTESSKPTEKKETASVSQSEKGQPAKLESSKTPAAAPEPPMDIRLSSGPIETGSTTLADGFDFPVGKPDAEGYYRARGFRTGGHMGEDWDGVRGGDTDLKDPIYCIGDGIVVFARDVHLGWGNVVIVRHGYKEDGVVKYIDSLYGHLNSILVKRGQKVKRGQLIATMGTAHGQYDAHLHLEIRKNLEIGMSRAKFQKNLTNYHDPSQFITSHRRLSGGGTSFRVAMNTFTHDGAYHFDDAPNYSARRRSTLQSSAALRRAVSSTSPNRD